MEGSDEFMTGIQEDAPQERPYIEGQQWAQEKNARLKAQIDRLVTFHERQQEILKMPDASLVAGIERWYSAPETAIFFARTKQWIYDRIRKEKFRYRDGEPIKPIQFKESVTVTRRNPETGAKEQVTELSVSPYRFNLPLIQAIAESCYRDGTVKMDELKAILLRVAKSEYEEVLFDPDEE